MNNFQSPDTAIDELRRRDRELKEIDRDLKRVADEFSDRKEVSSIKYCIDFDVLYSASVWHSDQSTEQLWSSLLFYFDQIRPIILPGTLFEILRFLKSQSNIRLTDASKAPHVSSEIGNVGLAFIDAVENNPVIGTPLVQRSIHALAEYKRRNLLQYRIYVLFDELRKRSEKYSTESFGEFDRDLFSKSSAYLADYVKIRKDRIINNRIDALNYTLCSQLNRNSEQAEEAPNFILVSNTESLSMLRRGLNSRISGGGRQDCAVWNSRVACIFEMISASNNSIIDARNTAWSLYQSLVDERRAIHFEIDRIEKGNKPDLSFRTGNEILLNLLAKFEGIQENIEKREENSDLAKKLIVQDFNVIDFSKFHETISGYIEDTLGLNADTFASHAMVNLLEDKIRIKRCGRDDRFTFQKRFNLCADGLEADELKHDVFITYEDRDQIIIRNRAPVESLVSVLNKVRGRLVAGLASGSYTPIEDLRERGRLLIRSESAEFVESSGFDFGWSDIVFSGRREDDETGEESFYDIGRRTNISHGDVRFFRFTNDYIDLSLEFGLVVFSTRPQLRSELQFVHSQFSRLNSDRVFRYISREPDVDGLPENEWVDLI